MIMLELLKKISKLGSAETENLLVSAGQGALKNVKSAHDWKKILVDTGEFFIENEKTAAKFFDDLSMGIRPDNMPIFTNLSNGFHLCGRTPHGASNLTPAFAKSALRASHVCLL